MNDIVLPTSIADKSARQFIQAVRFHPKPFMMLMENLFKNSYFFLQSLKGRHLPPKSVKSKVNSQLSIKCLSEIRNAIKTHRACESHRWLAHHSRKNICGKYDYHVDQSQISVTSDFVTLASSSTLTLHF